MVVISVRPQTSVHALACKCTLCALYVCVMEWSKQLPDDLLLAHFLVNPCLPVRARLTFVYTESHPDLSFASLDRSAHQR